MLFDYLECRFNDRYYNPPLSLDGLAIAARAAVYLYLLHDRRCVEGGEHRLPAHRAALCQGSGQLPKTFRLRAQWQERRHLVDPGQRGSRQGRNQLDREHHLRRHAPRPAIPPQLMGILSQNAGGFGSIKEVAEVYAANELEPLRARLTQVND